MNYRHAYHAGNHADVLKHAVLSVLLRRLCTKETPFLVFDTHAGIGRYDLHDVPAQRTAEWQDGIARVLELDPPAASGFLELVRGENPPGQLRFYPGSPVLVQRLMRQQDRAILCELHPDDIHRLRQELAGDPRMAIHHRNGYEALAALLPPRGDTPRRGLVLIDPPYESTGELAALVDAMETARQRWPTGQYAIWYPIKDRTLVWALHGAALAAGFEQPLSIELTVMPEDGRRLAGSGVLLLNPPWQITEELTPLLDCLLPALNRGGGSTRIVALSG